jgi:hypothetical protein
MQYYKIEVEQTIYGISTVNADGVGNITEEEYELLNQMLHDMPQGKQIHDNGNGTYEYEDAPEPPEPEPTAEELLDILTGGAE